MASRDGVSILELHDSTAIVAWADGNAGVHAVELVLRVIAEASAVSWPPEVTARVAGWDYVPLYDESLHAGTTEEFIDRCLPEIQSWRSNPFVVTVAGSDRRWYMATVDSDALEFGPLEPMTDFAGRVTAALDANP